MKQGVKFFEMLFGNGGAYATVETEGKSKTVKLAISAASGTQAMSLSVMEAEMLAETILAAVLTADGTKVVA